MARQNKILRLLKLLQGERDPQKRQEIIELSRKTLLKWFLIGAKNLLRGSIPVDKQTQRFIEKHREDLKTIADKKANEDNRLKAILKRGGAGFLGGVIIRNLLKWNLNKERIAKPKKRKLKSVVGVNLNPGWMTREKKKKLKKKDFVKTPPFRKDLPNWVQEQVDLYRQDQTDRYHQDRAPRTLAMKKQLPDWIQDQVSSYHENQTDLDDTIPYIDGKAIQKMDRAMQGPIGVARTSDNVMTSTPIKATQAPSLFKDILPFSPLRASPTPKRRPSLKLKKKAPSESLKYVCPHDGVGFRLKENYDRHMATAHNPAWMESQTTRKIGMF